MNMAWLIEPRDGLAFRDGRPNDGRSQSRSLAFPLPQTIAGAVRTRVGLKEDGSFGLTPDAARAIAVAGPLLVRGNQLLLPAPGDALWFEDPDSKAKEILRLKPLHEEVTRGGHVPRDGWEHLLPVGLDESRDGKPPKGSPAFWTWTHLETWLMGEPLDPEQVIQVGQRPLEQDRRMHVAIDSATGTHMDGALFGVSSLVFRSRRSEEKLDKVEQLSLAFRCEHPDMKAGLGYLGGKNQLAIYTQASAGLWPTCPPALVNHVRKNDQAGIRVMLATPGIFEAGWRPRALLESGKAHGVEIQLKAAKVDRPLTLSGWDYASKQMKKTRRAVPAGAVYWLELQGGADPREAWLREQWLQAISDDEQDCRDGFGLAVMGVWA